MRIKFLMRVTLTIFWILLTFFTTLETYETHSTQKKETYESFFDT
jgi:hypothetical protein